LDPGESLLSRTPILRRLIFEMEIEEHPEEFLVERQIERGEIIRETIIGTGCYAIPECLDYTWTEKAIFQRLEN